MRARKSGRSEAGEIISGSFKLVLSHTPLLPFRFRRRIFRSYVNGLSDVALGVYGVRLVLALPLSKAESSRYANAGKELDAVLQEMPRLDRYQGVLSEHIKGSRKKHKLK